LLGGQWGTGQKLAYGKRNWDDFNVTIEGMNALEAIDSWYKTLSKTLSSTDTADTADAVFANVLNPENLKNPDTGTKTHVLGAHAAAAAAGAAKPKQLWLQGASYPCKTCCSGGSQ
jgi:hypothetical protein